MKKKTLWIVLPLLLLVAAGCIGWTCRYLPAQRLLNRAERMVFCDVDSAARLLAHVDTAQLYSESVQAHYALLRALVHEEEWLREAADTARRFRLNDTAFIARYAPHEVPLNPRTHRSEYSDDSLFADSSLLRAHAYYNKVSFGGVGGSVEEQRCFGRCCWLLSRRTEPTDSLLQPETLLHQATFVAEQAGDWALAYRAYQRFAHHARRYGAVNGSVQHLCIIAAFDAFRREPDNAANLRSLVSDYAFDVIPSGNLPKMLSFYERVDVLMQMDSLAVRAQREGISDELLAPFYSLLARSRGEGVSADARRQRILRGDWEDCHSIAYQGVTAEIKRKDVYATLKDTLEDRNYLVVALQRDRQEFQNQRKACLAPCYLRQAATLRARTLWAIILAIAVMAVVVGVTLWLRLRDQRRLRAEEQAAHLREAEHLAERLRQKDTMIALLRGHIMDKSEILEMLEPTAGKRTIINARNWREIEATLDTADGGFVNRLRNQYPDFTEDDFRLCMLTRLKLTNTALSAIYLISVSAVQHRKQKLKKEGFGVTDPNVTFDQVIANY